jgi:steroid Delta-isomerase
MPTLSEMKTAMHAYLDHFNAGEVDAIIDLFSENAMVEDPVGKPPQEGRVALDAFYRHAVASGARLTFVAPICGSYGNAAAMALRIDTPMQGKQYSIQVIEVMTFDHLGKISSMHAYWGPDDTTLPEAR